MDDVRARMATVMGLLDQLATEPDETSDTVAAERSSASSGGDVA